MSVEMIGRMLGRAKELGLSPRGLSLKAGLGPTTVRDIAQRPGASPRAETVRKLADALDVTPEWLLYEVDVDTATEGKAQPSHQRMGSTEQRGLVEAVYGGRVEAGSWREVDDVDDPDRESEVIPRDDRFPRERYVIFEVVGDSMNAADPPMPEGCRVLAVATDNPTRPIPLRTGDLVVIQRKRAQGGLIERSVKEIEMGDEVTRYLPRSTNPKHKPLVYGIDPDDENESVEVLGLVIDVMHRVKRR